jgi:hypothetical protein
MPRQCVVTAEKKKKGTARSMQGKKSNYTTQYVTEVIKRNERKDSAVTSYMH